MRGNDSYWASSKRTGLTPRINEAVYRTGGSGLKNGSAATLSLNLQDLPDNVLFEIARRLLLSTKPDGQWELNQPGRSQPLQWLLAMVCTCKAVFTALYNDTQLWTSLINERLYSPGFTTTASEARWVLSQLHHSHPWMMTATEIKSEFRFDDKDLQWLCKSEPISDLFCFISRSRRPYERPKVLVLAALKAGGIENLRVWHLDRQARRQRRKERKEKKRETVEAQTLADTVTAAFIADNHCPKEAFCDFARSRPEFEEARHAVLQTTACTEDKAAALMLLTKLDAGTIKWILSHATRQNLLHSIDLVNHLLPAFQARGINWSLTGYLCTYISDRSYTNRPEDIAEMVEMMNNLCPKIAKWIPLCSTGHKIKLCLQRGLHLQETLYCQGLPVRSDLRLGMEYVVEGKGNALNTARMTREVEGLCTEIASWIIESRPFMTEEERHICLQRGFMLQNALRGCGLQLVGFSSACHTYVMKGPRFESLEVIVTALEEAQFLQKQTKYHNLRLRHDSQTAMNLALCEWAKTWSGTLSMLPKSLQIALVSALDAQSSP